MSNIIKEHFLQEYQLNKSNFTTGFNDLDSFIKNVQIGSIITIGSRPAMGKTEFILSIVNHLLLMNGKVSYFNLDTSIGVLIKRLVSNKMNLSVNEITNKQIDLQQLQNDLDFYNDKQLSIINKFNLSVKDIEKIIKNDLPQIIVIDYIQLLKTSNCNSDTIQEIKRIAIENNLIVIILSQISRRVERRNDHRPMLADLKSFDSLEELSDVVLMLYRDNYYNFENDNQCAEIIIRKNNFGDIGIINLNYINGHFANIERFL